MKIALLLAGAILASFESLASAGPAPNEEVSPLMSDTLIDNMGLVRHKRQGITIADIYGTTYYKAVYSGRACERITSRRECEAAARQRGLKKTWALEEDTRIGPPYCYYWRQSGLYFNNNFDSAKECSIAQGCLCKDV